MTVKQGSISDDLRAFVGVQGVPRIEEINPGNGLHEIRIRMDNMSETEVENQILRPLLQSQEQFNIDVLDEIFLFENDKEYAIRFFKAQ